MIYLDTSLLATMVVAESLTEAAHTWFDRQDPDELLLSSWVLAEAASALSIKQRSGSLGDADRRDADRLVAYLADEVLTVVDVLSRDFSEAARLCSTPRPALRAADALHLAVAARHGATLHTLDQAQAAAGRAHGLDAVVTVEKG